jgi:Zn-dependent protease with chaperone function
VTNLGVQAALVALGGVGMFLVVFELSRRGLLSLRYALGWMGVSVLLVGAGVLLVLVGGLSESLPFTPTGLLAAVGLAFVLLITLQLSISLSGQQEAIRQLSEANALLEERVSTLEHTVEHRADENRPIDH